MQSQKNLSILPIFLVVLIDLIGISIIIPIVAPLFISSSNYFNIPQNTKEITLGFLLAVYPLALFFGGPLIGSLSDRIGRKKVLMYSLFGTFTGYILFALALVNHNLVFLFLSRAIAGFAGGNLSVVYSSIADISDQKSKTKNFGIVGMAFGIGFIIGPFLGGFLSDPSIVSWFSSTTPIYFSALLSFVNILMIFFIFKETLKQKLESKLSFLTGIKNIKKAFGLKNLRVMFLVIFLLILGFSFFTQFFQVYLIEKFNYTQLKIGYFFAYIGLCIAIVQGLLTGPISKKYNPKQVLSVTLLALSLFLPLLIFPTNDFYFYLIMPLIAVANGLSQPNITSQISSLADASSQGEVLGIAQSFQALGFAIAPIVAGFIASINSSLPIIIGSILVFISWIIFVFFFKVKQKEVFHEL